MNKIVFGWWLVDIGWERFLRMDYLLEYMNTNKFWILNKLWLINGIRS